MCVCVLAGVGKVVRNEIEGFKWGHMEGHVLFCKQLVHLEGDGALGLGARAKGLFYDLPHAV